MSSAHALGASLMVLIVLAPVPSAADIVVPEIKVKPTRKVSPQRIKARRVMTARNKAQSFTRGATTTADRAHLHAGVGHALHNALTAATRTATPTLAAAERFQVEHKAKPTPRTVTVRPQGENRSGHGCGCSLPCKDTPAPILSFLIGLGLAVVVRRRVG